MGILDRLRAAAAEVGQDLTDSGRVAVYVRQLLRGNRAPHAASIRTPPPRAPSASPRVPVLLLQGYFANKGSVHLLAQRLHERGHVVMTYKLGHVNLGDIRDTAGLVARKVESLVTQTGIDRVDIIGHSMGGLVGLYYVKRLGGRHRVRRLVLMGTPAAGTWSAILGLVTAPFGAASRQLLPNSIFLRELRENPMPPGVELVTVSGARDFFAPLKSAALDGARHVELPTTHSGLLVEETVADALAEILDREVNAPEVDLPRLGP
jgi:pimeloyl-ACP methyl ester carboxylesterase